MRHRIFKISVNWGIVIGSSSRPKEYSKVKTVTCCRLSWEKSHSLEMQSYNDCNGNREFGILPCFYIRVENESFLEA